MDCKGTCTAEGTNEKTTKRYDAMPKACHELFSLQVTKQQGTRKEMGTSQSMHWKLLQEPIPSDDDDHKKPNMIEH